MENTKVSGGKQTAAHGQESKKSSGYKRNNNRKKNYYQQKKKKGNNSAKNDINKNFDELERKLEAKLESSLGLTPAAGGKKNNNRKNEQKKSEAKGRNNANPKNQANAKNKKNSGKNNAKPQSAPAASVLSESKKDVNNSAAGNKNSLKKDFVSTPKPFSEGGFFNFSKLKFGKKIKKTKIRTKIRTAKMPPKTKKSPSFRWAVWGKSARI